MTLNAGQRAVRDIALTSEVYKLEKFTVAGEREGTAKAETLQRQAPNVKNVISADTFGNRADANIAQLLENVVGISALRTSQVLALAEELGMRPLQAHCRLGLGKMYRQVGRQDEARTELSLAVAMLREMGMAFWLPEAEAELTQADGSVSGKQVG